MKNITILDVAKKAKTSIATVSNYLNNTGRMSEKTKQRIKKTIEQLNFYPNKIASILSKGKSNTIGFISSYLSSPFFNLILAGVEHKLYQAGKFKHSLEHYATRGSEKIKNDLLMELLASRRVSSIITVTFNIKKEIIDEYKRRGIHIVSIERKIQGVPSVCCNNFNGAYIATDYLIKNGRKRIAIITGILKPSVFDEDVSPSMFERMKGYKKALQDNNILFNKKNLFEVNFYNPEEGKRIIEIIYNSSIKFDAIFCAAGDIVAIGMIEKARELGIKIPEKLSIIGFDDVDMAKIITPSLTTIRQPLFKMGECAFELIEKIINGEKNIKNIVLDVEFIKRRSA